MVLKLGSMEYLWGLVNKSISKFRVLYIEVSVLIGLLSTLELTWKHILILCYNTSAVELKYTN